MRFSPLAINGIPLMTIEKITPNYPESKSADITQNNIDQLKQLFPEVFSEGKINFDALKAVLGEAVDDSDERYNFTWHGKTRARQIAQTPSTGTLRPCKEESVNWDTTENLFIEGDNLEVLKILQKSYHKKIKMIYIDPPYNTGKDFIYRDNFNDNIKNYLELTGQVDGEGRKIRTNSDTSGRYHSSWLNMMYPRLKLARNLLKDDGLIFISIDENEIANLKSICCEIFGEDNILGVITNINNPKGRSDDKFIATAHEYLLVIAKNSSLARTYGFEPDEKITKRYNKIDENGKKYRDIDLRKTGDADRREDRPDMFYYFYFDEVLNCLTVSKDRINSDLIEIKPVKDNGADGRWRWGFDTAKNRINDIYPKYMPTKKMWGIMEKDYLEGRPPVKPTSAWTHKDVNSERGSEQFIELGFEKEVFSRPKPIGTILRAIKIGSIPEEKSIVLDFFAGSGTSAHAVFEAVKIYNKNLTFIMVQLPELLDENKKENKSVIEFCKENGKPYFLSEITKERIKRASEKTGVNTGFKVFKLDETNIRSWDANFDNLEPALKLALKSIKDDRSVEDILYEILLKYGIELTTRVEEVTVEGKKIFIVGTGALIVCLDDDITEQVIEGIAKLKEKLNPESTQVVFKDQGFADCIVKTNAIQILKQYGINDVKSI
ncbi:Site-specific DNA-methyltransferase (Adenine-specific) [Xenorhabdus poinarii G6]|uniref:site-specific DNA-methyltransferase (adenine-specific) n=1 Tax=Xenorhabdus poinarii G6 TaxID=1354304 RepID=A0A068QXZ9_9GAMM|nr:site-specific DNA-methyltransferase [Xenorhabdus poinarii]CDG19669.1 Site-specific DNA-methyltransferase (Adenine-specific) [Xenorhabdus poinarii G6]